MPTTAKKEYDPTETLSSADLPGLGVTIPGVGAMGGVEYAHYQKTGELPANLTPAKSSADTDPDDEPDPEFVAKLQADEAQRKEGRKRREESGDED